MTERRHVTFVTPNFENNSLGRTYCLWLLAEHLGWSSSIVGVKGRSIWAPLAGSAFATRCVLPGERGALHEALLESDVVVAVKPLPSSLGVALEVEGRVPLVLDMDDPDIEVRTEWAPAGERIRSMVRKPRWYRAIVGYGDVARRLPLMVSNPELQRMYGGTVVPHVRVPERTTPFSDTRRPVVRFVGSIRGHKGIDVLREAVRGLSDDGFTLEVTASAPDDARAWERWIGTTTLDAGADLVRSADVVAIPSLRTTWGRAQLPAKLIDAMIAGRAIVATDLPPVAWALGGTGLIVPPGDAEALEAALRRLADPVLRTALGESARRRALELFTVDAVAPTFERVVDEAIDARMEVADR